MKFIVVTAPSPEELATEAAQFLWNYKIAAGVHPVESGFVIQVPARKEKSAKMYLQEWAAQRKEKS